ncbi:PREDICTED: mitochondrial Rho GTPase 1-like [Ipomoea nil]|uniref:mitochondrial Rho GTPase 1-like n=1 Tax=Ipomoea nil TaxID=35883 RepID=UPI000900EEC4|nr:PREDICTED: mitochondrial Rho GTPase 1-like [Ipomoea nil]
MAGGGSSNAKGNISGVRVIVAGEPKTGKSSLIFAAATESFPASVPPVLPPTRLRDDILPYRVPLTIIDTSSSPENRGKLFEEMMRADAVVLTYACGKPATLDRLSTYWLPELRRLEVKAPVIVVGCMSDKMDKQQAINLEQVMLPIMQQFLEIETCIECSAYNLIQVAEVFCNGQKTVLYPIAPLFDLEAQTLKPRYIRALKRIFILCDHDRDGALSDAEFNNFQVKCFNAPLQPSEILGLKKFVQTEIRHGVNIYGLTLLGFFVLYALFIEKGQLEKNWTVLQKFGYNNDIRLSEDQLPPPIKRQPDQSVELSGEAVEFLKKIFLRFDLDGDAALRSNDLDELFSVAPENPWNEAPYKDAAEKDVLIGLSLDGFLSLWNLMALLDPMAAVENLIYIGYAADPSSTIRVTQRRCLDRKRQQSDRNVYQCFVFGPKEAGKSAILNSFVGRPFSEEYESNADDRYAVNVVRLPGGGKKTLVLHEIPEDGVKKLLSSKDALAACDVAIFVYESSREASWKRASELHVDVASFGEATGYEIPSLIVAAKDDLDPYLTEIQDSTRVTQDMGIEAPIPISTKFEDLRNLFQRIVNAAERPHLSIPETEAGKSRKQYHRLINRSLMFVSVGNAVAVVGLAAYRVYAARKNNSS